MQLGKQRAVSPGRPDTDEATSKARALRARLLAIVEDSGPLSLGGIWGRVESPYLAVGDVVDALNEMERTGLLTKQKVYFPYGGGWTVCYTSSAKSP